MSTDWKNTSYDTIPLIVGLQDEPVQISQYTRAAGDNFRHYNLMPRSFRLEVLAFFVLLPSRQVNYELILVVVDRKDMLHDEPVQIPIDAPRLLDSMSATETQSSPPSPGPPGTTFELRLRLPPTRLLQNDLDLRSNEKSRGYAPGNINCDVFHMSLLEHDH